MTYAKIIADSVSVYGDRLTTFEVELHRFCLAELNTHRQFCLAGDQVLEFDLPAGSSCGKRVHKVTIGDFVDRWHNGAAPRLNKSYTGTNRQPIRERLGSMAIRQLNEETGLIQTSTVNDCWFSGEKPVYQVQTARHTITGSADHRIYTPEGFVTIGDLRRGDEIVVRRKGKRDEDLARDQFRKIGGQWRAAWQRKQRIRLTKEFGGCQKCESTIKLSIHHIIPVHIDPTLAFEETNILLICENCHKAQHSTQGWQAGQYLYGDSIKVERIGRCGVEPTFDLEINGDFENFIANGVVVHNSRNSASSRAIPVKKQINRILVDPAIPLVWPKEKPGMQGGEDLSEWEKERALHQWLGARDNAVGTAYRLIDLGLHKSLINRILEPFMWHRVIITTTEKGLQNFFSLRCSPLAQPEMRVAAEAMRDAYRASTPKELALGQWHAPYTDDLVGTMIRSEEIRKISAARCARVSYLTHDGIRDIDEDLAFYERLVTASPMHASPLEHVATPCLCGLFEGEVTHLSHCGNFDGWDQLRHVVEGVTALRRPRAT